MTPEALQRANRLKEKAEAMRDKPFDSNEIRDFVERGGIDDVVWLVDQYKKSGKTVQETPEPAPAPPSPPVAYNDTVEDYVDEEDLGLDAEPHWDDEDDEDDESPF